MCGIFGYINSDPEKKTEKDILVKMGEAIRHRGPDDNGFYLQDNAALGHNRLIIIDPETGGQPISNEDGTIWLSFNGELYNFERITRELKRRGHVFKGRTDSEILVHLYEDNGIDFLDEIEGMFSFALWDERIKKLFLVRDRFGIKPLYYAYSKGALIFASELKSVIAHPGVSKELDFTALTHYFTYGYVPDPMSIFKDIKKIPPAGRLVFFKDNLAVETYWRSSPREKKKYTEKEAGAELFYLLEDSVRKHLISDAPLGVFLSGGTDSSIIAYLAAAHTGSRLKTFSMYFDDAEYDESRYAGLVSEKLDTEHFSRRISSKDIIGEARRVLEFLDEPLADASFIPTYFLSSLAREHVKTCLSGDGADEIFAGYPTYPAQPLAEIYRKLPYFMKKDVFERLACFIPVKNSNNKMDFLLRLFFMGADYKDIERCIIWFGPMAPREVNNLLIEKRAEKGTDVFGLARDYIRDYKIKNRIERCLCVDRRFYLSGDILVKADRASMANSLETRVPYLDHRIVEFVDTLPTRFKLSGFTNKYILKKIFRGRLPKEILYRRKQGFNIPIGKLLKEGLLREFDDLLTEGFIKRQGIFDAGYVKNLISEHLCSKKDNRRQIWSIIAFQVWFNKYLGL